MCNAPLLLATWTPLSWCSPLPISSGKRVHQCLPLWYWDVWPTLPSRCNSFYKIVYNRAMFFNFGHINFHKFYSDLLLPFWSQTLENCTSLDSLVCVVYFYYRLKVICAASKNLERDKCWKVGCSYCYLNRPVGFWMYISHLPQSL